MHKILCIFNSKAKFAGIFLTVLAIIGIEISNSDLPLRVFYHEVDTVAFKVDHKVYNSQYLIVGDSTGGQLIKNSTFEKQDMADLTTNMSVEMFGQYFLIKRYLMNNTRPKGVIYVGMSPLGRNLDQTNVESFIQRIFVRNDEILEALKYRNLKFCLVMLLNKLSPTYRYRLFIQKETLGMSNANLYNGLLFKGMKDNKIMNFTPEHFERQFGTKEYISDIYFEKTIELLKESNINLYFVHVQYGESKYNEKGAKKSLEEMSIYLSELERKYDNFFFTKDINVYKDKNYMNDGIHFNKLGLPVAVVWFEKVMMDIQSNSIKELKKI